MGNCCHPSTPGGLGEKDMTKNTKPVEEIQTTEKENSNVQNATPTVDKVTRDPAVRGASYNHVPVVEPTPASQVSKPNRKESIVSDSNQPLHRKEKKKGLIQVEKESISENITKIEKTMDQATRDFLFTAFKKHYVLANLTEDEK